AGRWLRFVNATASPSLTKATISLFGGIDTINILNTELQSNSNGSIRMGVLFIGSGYKKEINLRNNKFSNSITSTAKPASAITTDLVYSSLTRVNNMTIVGNHFVNIDNAVIWWEGFLQSATIDSNHVYWNDAQAHQGRQFQGFKINGNEAVFKIRYNYIGGSEPYCGGGPWSSNGFQSGFWGIHAYAPFSNDSSYIEHNVIKNIRATTPTTAFFSGIFGGGLFNIRYNTVGDSTNNQSISLANAGSSFISSGNKRSTVSNNLVAGIEHRVNSSSFVTGIEISSDSAQIARNNTVRNINVISATPFTTMTYGIRVLSRVKDHVVEKNEVFNIGSSGTSPLATVVGIEVVGLNELGGTIRRNKVYGLTLQNTTGGRIHGISLLQTGSWKIENNQISLTNGMHTVPVKIYGIYDSLHLTTPSSSTFDFNSIVIGGTQASGATESYVFNKAANGTTARFKNNLLINERTGGSRVHGIIAVNKHTAWLPGIMDYNMLVVKDSNTAVLLQNNQVSSLTTWKQTTQSDTHGFIAVTDSISVSHLFEDPAKGDLNIKTGSEKSWYVNGNGLPLADIDADYNQTGIRSISIANGPVDIGSHEFTPTIAPPALIVNGSHSPGGTETFSMNGRTVATINWSQQGELPTLGNARFYSGTWP
ncbi:MAG: hypothetical protein J7527_16885, partial [Chitinophagaceae bacterium]|nr:hypothetical protein [Chitinophagaceae bacterium]